eukprot:scaffold2695_cov142-Isochrysis_galbana.AAC.4
MPLGPTDGWASNQPASCPLLFFGAAAIHLAISFSSALRTDTSRTARRVYSQWLRLPSCSFGCPYHMHMQVFRGCCAYADVRR